MLKPSVWTFLMADFGTRGARVPRCKEDMDGRKYLMPKRSASFPKSIEPTGIGSFRSNSTYLSMLACCTAVVKCC